MPSVKHCVYNFQEFPLLYLSIQLLESFPGLSASLPEKDGLSSKNSVLATPSLFSLCSFMVLCQTFHNQ